MVTVLEKLEAPGPLSEIILTSDFISLLPGVVYWGPDILRYSPKG